MDTTEQSVADDFSGLWRRIGELAGQEFCTKTGKPFSYQFSTGGVMLRNTNRMLGRGQFEQALRRMPLSGPGALQDLQGPSYLYAILTDSRITGDQPRGRSEAPLRVASVGVPRRTPQRPALATSPPDARAADLARPGRRMTATELRDHGFDAYELLFHDRSQAGYCNWDTLGSVPDAPGLYAFTLSQEPSAEEITVMYVGMTTHLWMVTKGQVPGGIVRPGQRYGRPQWAGVTRVRVNANVALAHDLGLHVQHWLRPIRASMSAAEIRYVLRDEEEQLITRWGLREVGWNRG
ncbi:hypothetical protein [Nocardioides sp. KR10-350]|uniref:hypothetical protein n=1 Tax=Nocardioides cheoyonin TaxID=3156615 RepID=UPI0032B341C5